MELKKRLRIMLVIKGKTQKDFANTINVNQSLVCRWLKGLQKPHIKYLKRICEYFEISLDVLFGNIPFVEKMLEDYGRNKGIIS